MTEPTIIHDLNPTASRTETTRRSLVIAALKLFSERGFEATTPRQIAEVSGANIASIAYHFGSKENLRNEVARSIVAAMRAKGPAHQSRALTNTEIEALSPDQARGLIKSQVARALSPDMSGELTEDIQHFMHREMAQTSPAADILFGDLLKRDISVLTKLVSRITGQPADTEATRAAAMMIIAQSMVFRLARPMALRAIGWNDLGERERDIILDNLWMT